ncbi:MAG: trypsin-like peptidase domain-containing protein [Nanoarchaeota archaeon]|nr:trypsin-like peptidase domain-containing protein [Nanoarchaeota archaeon]
MILWNSRIGLESVIALNQALGRKVQGHEDRLEMLIPLYTKLGGTRVEELTRQEGMTEYESDRNIRDNIVNIEGIDNENPSETEPENVQHSNSSAFLLTKDGFVVTAYHGIKNYEEAWDRMEREDQDLAHNLRQWLPKMRLKYAIVDQAGHRYPIDPTFRVTDPVHDLAIVKAVIGPVPGKEPYPINVNVAVDDLEIGEEIRLRGLTDQELYNQYGQVINSARDTQIRYPRMGDETHNLKDTFITNAYGVPGFSGGVFDRKGEFAGLALYIIRDENKEMGYVGGAKVHHILNLIFDAALIVENGVLNAIRSRGQ